MSKKSLQNLSAIQIVIKSDEQLSEEFQEEIGDWVFHSVGEFFDDNEAPCDIHFAVMLNDQELKLH